MYFLVLYIYIFIFIFLIFIQHSRLMYLFLYQNIGRLMVFSSISIPSHSLLLFHFILLLCHFYFTFISFLFHFNFVFILLLYSHPLSFSLLQLSIITFLSFFDVIFTCLQCSCNKSFQDIIEQVSRMNTKLRCQSSLKIKR
jgi:hypothetical protein